MATPPRKLKNFLILPDFQLKLLSYFLTLFALTTISLYSTSYFFFERLHQKALSLGIPRQHVFHEFIAGLKRELDLEFVLLAAINFLVLIGVGIVVSHKIAGPLFKLRRHLSEMNAESPEFKLRKGDFLQELVPEVNRVKEKMGP